MGFRSLETNQTTDRLVATVAFTEFCLRFYIIGFCLNIYYMPMGHTRGYLKTKYKPTMICEDRLSYKS